MSLKKIMIAVFVILFVPIVFGADSGAMLLGAYGTVVMHESGHAMASKFLGGEVLAYKPYPTKIRYLEPDGGYRDKWVLGVVMSTPFEGENADGKNAAVASMGSGANFLSVFLLAPLMLGMGSDFAKTSLDSMLLFSSFDGAGYVLTDLIFHDPNNDWSRVSKLTGVSLYWYLLTNIAGGLVANEYRYYWHKKAFPQDESNSHTAIGFSVNY